MSDLLERIDDLIVQAERERSHFYTASVLKEVRAEIARLRAALEPRADEALPRPVFGFGENVFIGRPREDIA